VAWLRGDPAGIRLLRSVEWLLSAQGIVFSLPRPGTLVDADVAVAPLPGTPEEAVYAPYLAEYPGPVIVEEDPLTAAALAIAYPRRGFSLLRVGVDPGSSCGVAAVADEYIIEASKVECGVLGEHVASLAARIPHAALRVYVGDGQGSGEAAASLEAAGIDYGMVDESWTTRRAPGGVARFIKDRDILASVAIALRGAYHGRVADRLPREGPP